MSQAIQGNLLPLIEDIPGEWRGDLADMEQLDDEALWKVGNEPLPAQQWGRHQKLLEQNQDGTLTERERNELERLRNMTNRFVFRRSYAWLCSNGGGTMFLKIWKCHHKRNRRAINSRYRQ